MSILMLSAIAFSIGYGTSQTTTVERTGTVSSVSFATSYSTSTTLYSYQRGSLVYALTTETVYSYHAYYTDSAACSASYDEDPSSPDYGAVYIDCPIYYYSNTFTTTHSRFGLVATQATGTLVFTSTAYYSYATSWLIGWVENVPNLGWLNTVPYLLLTLILTMSVILAIAAKVIVGWKERRHEQWT